MSIKNQLVKSGGNFSTATVSILGGKFKIQRKSAAFLSETEKKIKTALQECPESLTAVNAELILSSILEEDNKPLLETMTVDELIELFTPADIAAAYKEILKSNFMSNEAKEQAEKN